MKRIILGIIVMSLLSGVCLAAEDKGVWENLQKLRPGQKIQVMEVGAILREGKFKSVSQDQITIEVKKNTLVIPRVDVSRVVLKKSRTPRILMGLGIGAAIGLAVLDGADGEDSYYATLAAVPILTGGGGAVGALLPTSSIIYQHP
jgi:hypothetical protein